MADGRPPLRAVIFDLDGVLVDTEPVHERALRAFLAPADLTASQYAALVGTSVEHTLDWIRRTYERTETMEELRRITSDLIYEELRRAKLHPLDGAHELVDAVFDGGRLAAVASQSSLRWVEATLESIGLRARFEVVVTAESVARGKPAPDIYLSAADRLGVDPDRCLAIEDSLPGIASALAAHMRVIQLRGTDHAAPPQPDVFAVIDSLRDFDLGWLE